MRVIWMDNKEEVWKYSDSFIFYEEKLMGWDSVKEVNYKESNFCCVIFWG